MGGQVGVPTVEGNEGGGWCLCVLSFLGLRYEIDLSDSQRRVMMGREESTDFPLGKLSLQPCYGLDVCVLPKFIY